MKKYLGIKTVEAEPCTLDKFITNTGVDPYKGRESINHTPDDEGYMVKYSDNYVSQSPKDTFEASYHCIDTFVDRIELEYNELQSKIDKLSLFLDSKTFKELDVNEKLLLAQQHAAMIIYRSILRIRIESYCNKK